MESENTKQLTVVINDIPEKFFNDLWKIADQRSKQQFGLPLEKKILYK